MSSVSGESGSAEKIKNHLDEHSETTTWLVVQLDDGSGADVAPTPEDYLRLNESLLAGERHFNQVQASYRRLASTWVLAAFGGMGYVATQLEPTSSTLHGELFFGLGLAAAIGVFLIWLIDHQAYFQLLESNFLEGLRLEVAGSTGLLRVRTRMVVQKAGAVGRTTAYFYIGLVCGPAITGAALLVQRNENLLGASLLACTSVLAGVILSLSAASGADARFAMNRVDTTELRPTRATKRLVGAVVLALLAPVVGGVIGGWLQWDRLASEPVTYVSVLIGLITVSLAVRGALLRGEETDKDKRTEYEERWRDQGDQGAQGGGWSWLFHSRDSCRVVHIVVTLVVTVLLAAAVGAQANSPVPRDTICFHGWTDIEYALEARRCYEGMGYAGSGDRVVSWVYVGALLVLLPLAATRIVDTYDYLLDVDDKWGGEPKEGDPDALRSGI